MNKETLQGYNNRLSDNNDTITNINSLLKRLPVSGEDLTEELTNYDSGLTTQETSIQDIIEALEGKAAGGGGGKYAPRFISFYYYSGTDLNEEIANLDTSNITSMYYMFAYNRSLTSLDLSNFNTSNVTDMHGAFYYCKNLTELDLSNFDTSNVTNMSYMFRSDETIVELNLSSFDTSNVTNMERMFEGCNNIIELDLSNFDTSNVTNMKVMFYGCSSLQRLDIRNFDFSNVTSYDYMFGNSPTPSSFVPTDCEIIVKDDTAKSWVLARRSAFTNVKTVAELEAS